MNPTSVMINILKKKKKQDIILKPSILRLQQGCVAQLPPPPHPKTLISKYPIPTFTMPRSKALPIKENTMFFIEIKT